MDRQSYLYKNAGNSGFLEGATEAEGSPLALVREEADTLRKVVNGIANNSAVHGPQITEIETVMVRAALSDFERAFLKALKRESVFQVESVGIYDTGALIERADEIFPPDTLSGLVDTARADWRAAGRCLAFELGTAAGFHTIRATESAIHQYYVRVTGDVNMKRKDRNWGAYVRNFNLHQKKNPNSRVDTKLVALVDQIRLHHRNPVMHPEETLTPHDAYALFNVCQSAILMFVSATQALP